MVKNLRLFIITWAAYAALSLSGMAQVVPDGTFPLGGSAASIKAKADAELKIKPVYVYTKAAIAALDPVRQPVAELIAQNASGVYAYSSGNYSTLAALDTYGAIVIQSGVIPFTTGAYVRQYTGNEISSGWFGTPADLNPTLGSANGTNATPYLNSAFAVANNLGMNLDIIPGNYRINTGLVSKAYVSLHGGNHGTTNLFPIGANCALYFGSGGADSLYHQEIYDLSFNGKYTTGAGCGVYFAGTSSVTQKFGSFRNDWFQGFANTTVGALQSYGNSYSISVEKSHFIGNYRHLQFDGNATDGTSTNLYVHDNIFEGSAFSTSGAIWLHNVIEPHIGPNNIFTSNNSLWTIVDYVDATMVSTAGPYINNNYFETNGLNGSGALQSGSIDIYTLGASATYQVFNARIKDNVRHGTGPVNFIWADYNQNLVVDGNTGGDAGQTAVRVTNDQGGTVVKRYQLVGAFVGASEYTVPNGTLATMAANTIKLNNTGSAAAPIDATVAQTKTLLALVPADITGLGALATASTVSLSTQATGTLQAAQEPAHTGDATNTAGSLNLTIPAGTVTNAKQANMNASTIKGNNAATGPPVDLTVAQTKTLLAISSADVSGLGALATVTPGTGVATAAAAAVTGSGGIVLSTSPTITTPNVSGDLNILSGSVIASGNITRAAWTTTGLIFKTVVGAIYTDTTSTGTVARMDTNRFDGGTIAASSAVTYTEYNSAKFTEPIAGTNVTIGTKWAIFSDSLKVGTSNPFSVTINGVMSAVNAVLTTPNLGTPSAVTLTNATGLPISTGVSGLGTGTATALGVNIGTAGAVITNGGALGTPSSGTLTNATGLPISTGVSGLGAGVATALASAPSATGGLEKTFTATTAVSAAGTTQGTATALTSTSDNQLFEVTTVAASSGVVLPTSTASLHILIVNRGANTLAVYPASTGTINGGSASAAIFVGAGQPVWLVAKDASNNWYSNVTANSNVLAFTATGTYTASPNLKFAEVILYGGGGCGGSGALQVAATTSSGGGGGGGGSMAYGEFTAAKISASQTVTIAAACTVGSSVTGASALAGNAGTAGGTTTFGSILSAPGGGGGAGGGLAVMSGGGAGGSIAAVGGSASGATAGVGVLAPNGGSGAAGAGSSNYSAGSSAGGTSAGLLGNAGGYALPNNNGGSGGGSGAGISAANALAAGGAGGQIYAPSFSAATAGTAGATATGGPGGAGNSVLASGTLRNGGGGGAGGGSGITTGGAGGAGGLGGGGGGGGGASQTSGTSGPGGAGGLGYAIVIEHF